MVKSAFLMKKSLPFSRVRILESKDSKCVLSLPETDIFILVVSGTIKGRILMLCGAIGFKIQQAVSGDTIGPPLLKEYPVEPVGVAMISPSAQ